MDGMSGMGSMTMSSSMPSSTGSSMSGMSGMGSMSMSGSMPSSSSSGMSGMSGMGGMSGMDDMSMNMYFTGQYLHYPILFKQLYASNGGQAFGIFLLFFVAGILARGIDFLKNYLEQVVWENPSYINKVLIKPSENSSNGVVEAYRSRNSKEIEGIQSLSDKQGFEEPVVPKDKGLLFASRLFRNIIRLTLCFLSELLGFALMLAAMSFTILYFFAVVIGLSLGRFLFERLAEKFGIRPEMTSAMHC